MKLIICILGLTAMVLAGDDDFALLKQGNDKFTAQMFYQVATSKENVGKSVILSAFSVMPPLAQLGLASVGESHDEILNAIGLPNDNTTKAAFSKLNEQLRSVKGVELTMANRIYVAQDAKLNQQFAEVSRNVFNSDVKNVDFSAAEATVGQINSWVEDHTNHKIKNLLNNNAVDSTTRLVLVNAIYFKGSWLQKFNANMTTDRDFYVSEDKTVKVPTMILREEFSYAESAELDAKILELPYEGNECSLVVVLPNQKDGITNLQEKLKDASLLETAIANLSKFEVNVLLPKFKIETETDLKEILTKMNINKMFSASTARLDNLLDKESNLYVSAAIQKAFIEVNEEGAEASAANAIIILGSSPYSNEKTFNVDRPFYFDIKHGNMTLFNGVVWEPQI